MKKLTHEEYLAFILLYAAYADLELKREEVKEILECIDKDIFIEIRKYFLSMNDANRLQVIQWQKGEYLDTEQKRNEALKEIRHVFLSDQNFPAVEQFYFNLLKRELS